MAEHRHLLAPHRPGYADRSYGIHVARLAGVPEEVLERANEVLAELEAHPPQPRRRSDAGRRRGEADGQPTLFDS